MLYVVSLNSTNLQELLKLNDLRKNFNILNEDFYEHYTNTGFTKQFIMRRNVKLLKVHDDIGGYIWVSRYDKNRLLIKSMYVSGGENLIDKYRRLIDIVSNKKILVYSCERNDYNYDVLKSIGFKKLDGTYEMSAKVTSASIDIYEDDLNFERLKKGKHEQIRCAIQNEVFKNDSRMPLTVDDIYFDEIQTYYFEDGAILVKKGDKYIGYGQIILNCSIPTIVNVGILKEYRGKGYGKLLMSYLFTILKDNGYNEVNLKVSSNNYAAINLYKSLGFELKSEVHNWEY